MRARGVPTCYVKLTERMLTGRQTCLKLDDYTSDPIPILNSTTQGCPLSMLFYAFYNAPLIQVATLKYESSLGFVDDSMLLAVADSPSHTTWSRT